MTQRVVIADAGPLIALARIEALHLLRQLFGRVSVTTTVRDEILPAKAAFADAEMLVRTLAARLEAKNLRWWRLDISSGHLSFLQCSANLANKTKNGRLMRYVGFC